MQATNAMERNKGILTVGIVLTPGTYTVDLNEEPTKLCIEFVLPKGTPATFIYSKESAH